MANSKDVETLHTIDQGEKAFEEGLALLDTLQEACGGRSTLPPARMATVLGVMRERISQAQAAFERLAV